jgi:8-oxo-dGTP diphosphatase
VWGVPGIRLPTVTYQVWSGESLVDKQVEWWAMTVAADDQGGPDTFTPGDEVDGLAWLSIGRALETLTYARDRQVVTAYAELPPLSRPVLLLRHASVGDPTEWSGPDADRPLDPTGEEQAATIARLVPLIEPARLISAQPLRCRQTLADLAGRLAVEVEIDTRFDDSGDPDTAAAALRSLAGETATVACSQGWIIAAAVARLSGRPEPDHVVAKGDGLMLSFSGDTLVAADQFTPSVS